MPRSVLQAEKADELKENAQKLAQEKNEKQELYDKFNTSEMKAVQKEKDCLKARIDTLIQEKNNILFNNQEFQIKNQRIKEAKAELYACENAQKEILKKIELNKMQKKIANK